MIEKLEELIKKFNDISIKIGFGFEFEFYILDSNKIPIKQDDFINIIQYLLDSLGFRAIVHKELALGQVEIASIASFDILNIIKSWNETFEEINRIFSSKNLIIDHRAKPFNDQPGNGLHINISLHNNLTNENLFGTKDFSDRNYFEENFYHPDIQNSLLAYSIAGLLELIKHEKEQNTLFNDSTIRRIQMPDRNSPINISWGYNNRTTLIRIPESLPEAKRLENRLFSSEDDIVVATLKTIEGIYNGIVDKANLQRGTFGLAFDKQYELDSLASLA